MGLSVLKTPPPDYAAFRQVVGEFKGLETAIQFLTEQIRGQEEL